MVALLVVCTILMLLGVDLVVQAVERKRHPVAAAARTLPALTRGLWQRVVPQGMFLDSGHATATLESSGRVRVSVDQLVLAAIGKIDRIETLTLGAKVKRGQPILRLHRGDEALQINAPASGTIRDWNTSVMKDPALVYQRLYTPDGWMLELETERLEEELPLWKIAKDTGRWMADEINRLRLFAAEGIFSGTPEAVLADGGNPVEGFLAETDKTGWDRFNQEFLRSARR